MNAPDILDTCIDAWVVLSRRGGGLHAEPIEGGSSIPTALVELLRDHKQDMLRLLDYQEKADALLLASTAGLASKWPAGCILDGPEWEALEDALTTAYWTQDLDTLRAAPLDRDAFALDVFNVYRVEHAA